MQPTVTPEAPRRAPSIIPPWWSCLLMTLAVVSCVGGLAAALVALGVRAPDSPTAPELVVLTAPPELLTGSSSISATPDSPVSVVQVVPLADFSMRGPTLPAVIFTPTPTPLTIGQTVQVIGVADQQLNVRDTAGVIGTSILFRAPEGTRFVIGGGPVQADGLTWWRIDDPSSNRSGWAVSNYLQAIASQ